MIDNIAGINIWTDNFKEMSNFYENILSLKVHSTKDNWISFEYLDFRLNIGTHSMVNNKNNDSYRIMINLFSILEILTSEIGHSNGISLN